MIIVSSIIILKVISTRTWRTPRQKLTMRVPLSAMTCITQRITLLIAALIMPTMTRVMSSQFITMSMLSTRLSLRLCPSTISNQPSLIITICITPFQKRRRSNMTLIKLLLLTQFTMRLAFLLTTSLSTLSMTVIITGRVWKCLNTLMIGNTLSYSSQTILITNLLSQSTTRPLSPHISIRAIIGLRTSHLSTLNANIMKM